MRRALALAVVMLAVAFPFSLSGQQSEVRDVTFTRDVAPILYENCAYCHRPGEVAPFSLLSYQEARPWARAIKQAVVQRTMPPWRAHPGYGEFRNARLLSNRDIDTLVAWADGGATEGDPEDLPPPPQYAEGWQIGTPDLILEMAEPVTIPATGTIPYATYPSGYVFPEDTWIQAIEVRPGNRRVVHHAVAQANPPGESPMMGAQNVHLYSPGLEAMIWREGYGKFFPKGTTISFQMHYNAIGRETTDQTKIGFRFAKAPVHTQVNTTIVINNSLVVPPMVQKHEVVAAFQFPVEARIHGLRPHMHLRARVATTSLIAHDGLRRVLLHIPEWDDGWQNYYVLSRPARVKTGAILEHLASYDNSPANPLNPDPTVPVTWGQQVWDEMHSVYVTWTAVNEHNVNDDEPIQIPPSTLFTTGLTARQ